MKRTPIDWTRPLRRTGLNIRAYVREIDPSRPYPIAIQTGDLPAIHWVDRYGCDELIGIGPLVENVPGGSTVLERFAIVRRVKRKPGEYEDVGEHLHRSRDIAEHMRNISFGNTGLIARVLIEEPGR